MERGLENPSSSGQRRLIAGALVGAIVIVSVAASVLVALKFDRDHEEEQRAEVHRVAVAFDGLTSLSIAQLRSAAAILELRPDLAPAQFEQLIEDLIPDHSVLAVSFLEALEAGRGESRGATPVFSHGGTDFVMRLHSARRTEGRLLLRETTAQEHLGEVATRARTVNTPMVSGPVGLRGLDGQHLVLFQSVDVPASGSAGMGGLVAGVIGIADLLETAAAAVPSETQVALVGQGGRVLSDKGEDFDDFAATRVNIANRALELRLVTPQSQIWALPLLLGLAGLALAGIITLLMLNWSRRERSMLAVTRKGLEERNRAMAAEAETNRMYRLLAENLTDMVMVTDPAGVITYVSPAGRHMLGWEPEEMIGEPILGFLHPEDEEDAQRHLQALRSGAGIHTFEHRLRRQDGSFVWAESAVRSIFDSASDNVVEFRATTRDISERKPLQEQLERFAREDPLTGLSNRRHFNETLTAELARAQRSASSCAVLLIDIDHFKRVNDSFGHLTGDRVLRRVAEALRSRMRVSDTVARLGGDEFAAILPEAGEEQAKIVGGEILESVRASLSEDPDLAPVTVSVGIATLTRGHAISPELLLERADMALYGAKAEGRDRVWVYGPQARSISDRLKTAG